MLQRAVEKAQRRIDNGEQRRKHLRAPPTGQIARLECSRVFGESSKHERGADALGRRARAKRANRANQRFPLVRPTQFGHGANEFGTFGKQSR
jgi:hypothetical protein